MSHLYITNKGDQAVRYLADRHYSRQTVGNPQFCRPGFNIVMKTLDNRAALVFWSGIADHEWKDCWENTLFRNESDVLSSVLLAEAASHMFHFVIGEKPKTDGLISFVQKSKVKSTNPGFCYICSGWKIAKENDKFRVFQLIEPPSDKIKLSYPQLDLF